MKFHIIRLFLGSFISLWNIRWGCCANSMLREILDLKIMRNFKYTFAENSWHISNQHV